MRQVISLRDLEELARNGKDPRNVPGDALLTPSARDYLRDFQGNTPPALASNAGSAAKSESAPPKAVTAKSPKADIDAFFTSPAIHELKLQICDVGRRLWMREYVDGNGGNIAIKVGETSFCALQHWSPRVYEDGGHVQVDLKVPTRRD